MDGYRSAGRPPGREVASITVLAFKALAHRHRCISSFACDVPSSVSLPSRRGDSSYFPHGALQRITDIADHVSIAPNRTTYRARAGIELKKMTGSVSGSDRAWAEATGCSHEGKSGLAVYNLAKSHRINLSGCELICSQATREQPGVNPGAHQGELWCESSVARARSRRPGNAQQLLTMNALTINTTQQSTSLTHSPKKWQTSHARTCERIASFCMPVPKPGLQA